MQSQKIMVFDFIDEMDLKNFVSYPVARRAKRPFQSIQSKRMKSDLVLSELYNRFFYKTIIYFIQLVKELKDVPAKFYIVEGITLLLSLVPYILLHFDRLYSWTNLSVFSYIFISLCALSLFITAIVAQKEWMDYKHNGKI